MINDWTKIEGQRIDSQRIVVGTIQRDHRFKRRLSSFVRKAIKNTMNTNAIFHCGEQTIEPSVSRRKTNIHALADDEFTYGAGPAFLCRTEPADEDDLSKADRRIAHALNNELPRLYEPGADGSKSDVRGDKNKYMEPKYKNLDSLLRYVETDSGQGAVKVVIMNFND